MSKNTTVSITLKLKGNAGADLSRISVEQIKHTQKITAGWNMAAVGQAKFTDQMRRSTTETKQAAGASDQLLRTNRMLEGVLRQQAIQTRLLSGQLKAQNRDYTLQTRMLSEQARHARDLQRAMADAARSQRDMSRNQPKTGSGIGGMVGGVAGGAAAAYAMVRNPLERARSFETKIFDATASVTGGFAGMNHAQVQASNLELNTYAKDAVRQGHGSVDGIGDAAGLLAGSGLYKTIADLKEPLMAVAESSFASGASEQDMAVLVQQLRMFGISNADLRKGLDQMLASGYEGGFELKDMARLFPPVLSSAKKAGYSGLDGLATVLTHTQLNRKATGIPAEAADNMRDFYELLSQRHFQLAIGKYITPEEGDPIKKIGLRGNRKGFDMNKYLADHLESGGDAGEAVVALMNRQLSKTPNYVRLQNEIIALEKSGGNPDLVKSKKAAQQMVASGVFGNIFHNMQSGSAVTTTFRGMQDPTELGFDAIRAATIDSEGTTAKVKSEKKQIESAQAHGLEQQSILTTIKMYDTVKERLGNFEAGLTKTMQANEALTAAAYAAAGALAVLAAAKVGGGLLGGGAAAAGGAAGGAAAGGLLAAARTVLRAPVGALAGSAVGMGSIGAGVLAAGAVGYGAGTLLNKGLIEGTDFGDSIGGTITEALALFGVDTAQQALESNKLFEEMIRLQEQQLEAARVANLQRDQQKNNGSPQPVAPYSPRNLMLGLSDTVNQESQRGAPMWRPH